MKSIIYPVLAFALGTAGSYFYLSEKNTVSKTDKDASGASKQEVVSPTTLSTRIDLTTAHDLSVQYRRAAGLCADPITCTSKEGIFELSPTTIADISVAIDKIQRGLQESNVRIMPAYYRFYMGVEIEAGRPNTKLLVVGLQSDNRTEYTDFIEKIDGHLPCPTMCDVMGSAIFMGSGDAQNCCLPIAIQPGR